MLYLSAKDEAGQSAKETADAGAIDLETVAADIPEAAAEHDHKVAVEEAEYEFETLVAPDIPEAAAEHDQKAAEVEEVEPAAKVAVE